MRNPVIYLILSSTARRILPILRVRFDAFFIRVLNFGGTRGSQPEALSHTGGFNATSK